MPRSPRVAAGRRLYHVMNRGKGGAQWSGLSTRPRRLADAAREHASGSTHHGISETTLDFRWPLNVGVEANALGEARAQAEDRGFGPQQPIGGPTP